MSKFPGALELPDAIPEARKKRERNLVRAAAWGIGIRASIVIFELFGVYFFGSHALLMDALASFIDILTTIALIICIKLAERPPDHDHPFGHGRYEPLAGALLGLFLAAIGAWMVARHSFNLTDDIDHSISPFVWVFPFVALILLEISYRTVMYVAKKENSPALATDAIHYRIDAVTSLFAAIVLIAAVFYPKWGGFCDDIGALAISILMIILGVLAAKDNFYQLLDSPPEKQYFQRVREASLRVPGVRDTEKLRMQRYGPDAHVDIDIEVDPHLTVEAAHKISQHVRIEIQKEWPAVRDVTVHIEPFYENDH